MKFWTGAILALLVIDGAPAAEKLRGFSWAELKAGGRLTDGRLIAARGSEPECVLIENVGSTPRTAKILEIDQPGITSQLYALRGRIKWEGVEGTAYLEMWNHFPDGSAYFSRTLAGHGPMAALRGSGGWRDVVLPFSAAGATHHPSRLVVNVVLPGKGKVWVGNLVLSQYREGENPLIALESVRR